MPDYLIGYLLGLLLPSMDQILVTICKHDILLVHIAAMELDPVPLWTWKNFHPSRHGYGPSAGGAK